VQLVPLLRVESGGAAVHGGGGGAAAAERHDELEARRGRARRQGGAVHASCIHLARNASRRLV
jgi:hypothetical protein